ncbi:hypothetical protein 3 [Hubei tombus-like virus 7]|uniref:hypothetical protein 3 n=1 Tax=Hubei tombus-like virus 7 TaxID=1923294 RepID=UPI00090C12B4|nr:hypothetical protein 3 [Hubei tombus-like virus 7]APG76496.1 hypothetical protein 3 [Hubei tombus-like virus 7]
MPMGGLWSATPVLPSVRTPWRWETLLNCTSSGFTASVLLGCHSTGTCRCFVLCIPACESVGSRVGLASPIRLGTPVLCNSRYARQALLLSCLPDLLLTNAAYHLPRRSISAPHCRPFWRPSSFVLTLTVSLMQTSAQSSRFWPDHRGMPRNAKTANPPASKGGQSGRQTTPSSRPRGGTAQKVRGKGEYLLPGTFAHVGRKLGEKAGGWLGGGAGALLSTVTGMGDYQMNNIMHADRALTSAHPKSYEFTNTELVQVVASTGEAFQSYQYANNPGLGNFPWLSAIAQRFNKYRFKQLVYHFESTSSEYAAGAGLGTVAIATNYDAVDREFASMVEMEATENAVSGKPSVDKLHGVECATAENALKWWYVRSGPPPASTDLRMYDMSETTLATEGLFASPGTVIGRLKVFYTVEFCNPIALGIPAPYLPAPVTLRSWYAPGAAAAGVGPYFGLKDSISSPTWSVGPYQTLPVNVSGGSVGSIGVTTYPVVDVTTNTLKFYCRGTFYVTARFFFSTAPTVTTIAQSTSGACTLNNPYSAGNTWHVTTSTDKTLLSVEGVITVTSASYTTPASVSLSQSGWGSTFVIGSALTSVSYVGQP